MKQCETSSTQFHQAADCREPFRPPVAPSNAAEVSPAASRGRASFSKVSEVSATGATAKADLDGQFLELILAIVCYSYSLAKDVDVNDLALFVSFLEVHLPSLE